MHTEGKIQTAGHSHVYSAGSLFFSLNSVGVMRRDVLAKGELDKTRVSPFSLHGQRHAALWRS